MHPDYYYFIIIIQNLIDIMFVIDGIAHAHII